MTEGSGAKGAPHPFTDEARALGLDVDDPRALAWMEAHLSEFREQASGQRPLYWILGIGFVVGLAAQVVGFLLKASATTEPLLLVADLLYALGWSLWTGVVVVFIQPWRPSLVLDSTHGGRREGDLLRCSSCRQLRVPSSWGEVAVGEQPPGRRDPDHEDGQQDRQGA